MITLYGQSLRQSSSCAFYFESLPPSSALILPCFSHFRTNLAPDAYQKYPGMVANGDELNIPIVDFGKFLNGGKDEKEHVAREIDRAFREVGFVYLNGHGVENEMVERCFEWVCLAHCLSYTAEHAHFYHVQAPEDLLRNEELMRRQSKKFFDLPIETKMLAPHPPGGSHHRGYSAPGVEKVSQHAYGADEIAKLREVFFFPCSYSYPLSNCFISWLSLRPVDPGL